ncbi:hypothetical protein GCM10027570_02690 [Streptomonospora sediminis]
MRRCAALAVSLALAVLPAAPAAAAPPSSDPTASDPTAPAGPDPEFRITDDRIEESSGLAASRRHDGVYWTHNDSGSYGPEIYAVDEQGDTLATVTLAGEGVEARDWEAIAVGAGPDGDPAVYVGDIGDNFQGGWPSIRVYRLPEPGDLTDQTIGATAFTLVYEDGGRDAEAMMVDPRDNRLYVLSKEVAGGVYAAPEQLDPGGTNTLKRVDSAPLYATDAAFSRDGAYYAVRTYWAATVYDAEQGVRGRIVERVPLPESDQGESLAFAHDGRSLLAGTEGPGSPVWRVPLETAAGGGSGAGGKDGGDGGPSAGAGGEAAGGSAGEDAGTGAAALIWTGAGLAVVVIAAIVLLARRG